MITETKEYKDWLNLKFPLESEDPEDEIFHKQCQSVANQASIVTEKLLDRDKYAMEFHNWVKREYVFTGHKYYSRENEHAYGKSLSELLEIFKKQR